MSPKKITTDKKSKETSVEISPKTQPLQSKTDTRQLIHGLEAQNEALIRSQAETQAVLRQYTDLYDFAPISYFTLGRDGTIRQANLNGAHLLGIDRDRLVRQNFGFYVAAEFSSDFDAFLERVFSKRGKEICEIVLLKKQHEPIWTHIEATYSDA
jgi:PAS domain-containing protein